MISSYIKLAWRVLVKKKFFSFITLFGISITLMVLMLFISFWETQTGSNPPISEKDRMLFAHRMELRIVEPDTLMTIDTLIENGQTRIDTTYTFDESATSTSTSGLSYHFANTKLREIDNISAYSFYSSGHSFDLFVNDIKLAFDAMYSDASYFNIFDFNFIDGHAWTAQDFEQQKQVLVISDQAAMQYFGRTDNVVGQEIEIEKKHFKITGVIAAPTATLGYAHAHVYMPYTHLAAQEFATNTYLGEFEACFLAQNTAQLENIKQQVAFQAKDLPDISGGGYNQSEANAITFDERFAHSLVRSKTPKDSQRDLLIILSTLLGLFILLPILNLVNLNVSRMMDRSAEIGVRKSFGAGKRDLVVQFIFENIILTLLGGLIGFLLTLLMINILNTSGAMNGVQLNVRLSTVFYSLLVTIIFGVLSGVLPALRMAKLHIVQALKRS